MEDLSNYKFSKDFLKQSSGLFRHSVKARYKDLDDAQIDTLVEREYGKELKDIDVVFEKVENGNGLKPKKKTRDPKQ